MKELFKRYDIRGIYGKDITKDFATKLGIAVIMFTKARNVVIGYDSRHGNLELFSAISKSIIDAGASVTHAGIISRPMLNWVAWSEGFDLGIVITASHNPKEYNGFKFVTKGSMPLYYDNGLDKVQELMGKKFKAKKKGRIISKDYIDEYIKFLSSHLTNDYRKYSSNHSIKIVADASNGSAGEIIRKFFEANHIEYELLFADPDGNFPCHNPNPLDDSALIVLGKSVERAKADFGFIVDPDADRIRFVDEKGKIVDNSYVSCILIKHILSKNKGKAIVHDLISKKIISETIRRYGGSDSTSKVGTSNIIENMKRDKAIYGCEMSGHNYFKSMNYLDSGMMMLVYVLNTVYCRDNAGKRFSTLTKPFNKYTDLGEMNYQLKAHDQKSVILDDIYSHFKMMKPKKISRIDGISVIFPDVWLNIRPSNTEPLLRLRIEGKSKKILLKMKKEIEKLIQKHI